MNFGNNHKNTAIHLAAQNGWTKVMEWLLKAKNINVNAKDLHANTALHLAAQNGAIGVCHWNICLCLFSSAICLQESQRF